MATQAGFNTLDQMVLTYLVSGSIVVGAQFNIPAGEDPTDFYGQLVTRMNNNINGYNLLSMTSSPGSPTTATTIGGDSVANLGLILGITLPLVILLAVVIIVFTLRSKEHEEKEESENTDKQVQDF